MSATTLELFPDSPRVLYGKSPLVEVVCQLKFPPILRIDSNSPADFQERIRKLFPILERGPAMGTFPAQFPPQIAQLLGQPGGTTYTFYTEDRNTFLSLASDFISINTKSYKRWEDFMGKFQLPFSVLCDIYQPSFLNRVGLRYTDGIELKPLGLDKSKWSDLLRREVLGELALPKFEDHLEDAQRVIRLKFPDGNGSILMRHGLGQVVGHTETCYMIDLDFFTEQKVEVGNVFNILSKFNSRAGRAFRWCITEKLHNALDPRPIED